MGYIFSPQTNYQPAIAVTRVTAVSPEAPGAPLKIGDTLTFTLATDLSVDSVTGGSPTLTLSNGATASYTGFDPAGLHFSYTRCRRARRLSRIRATLP